MPTVIRQNGFDVVIFTNDHRPAHVHVFKAGTEAVLTIVPVTVRENYRMSKRNLRKAVEIVEANQDQLVQAWTEIHGNE